MKCLGTGKNYDLTSSSEDHEEFNNWLQCYNNPDMECAVDHQKRTIYFKVSLSYHYLPSTELVGRSWTDGS